MVVIVVGCLCLSCLIAFSEQVTESDTVDVIKIAIKHHALDLTTKAMALMALLKLSSRFPSCSEYVFLSFYLNAAPLLLCNFTRLLS